MTQSCNRLLMVCCTKNRPDRIQDMLRSFYETKNYCTDLIVCLDKEDKRLAEYAPVLKDIEHIMEHPNYQTKMMNLVTTKLKKGYKYYGLMNDDHIFRTKNWDVEMIDTIEKNGGWGIAHANDLWYNSSVVLRHPSCFIISANIINAVGYCIYPELNHFGVDDYLRDLTEPLGLLFFREDVVIEHMHVHNGKAQMDENYQWGYCEEEVTYGNRVYNLWRILKSDRDRGRITKQKEGSCCGKETN